MRTNGGALNTHDAPTSLSSSAVAVPNRGDISIVCQAVGERVTGSVRVSRVWDRLPNGTYVSDAFIERRWFEIPVCEFRASGLLKSQWMLPVIAPLTSGFRTVRRPNHDGVDLGAARGTWIRAVAAGTITKVACQASTNDCNTDGNRHIAGCGWYVEIEHPGRIATRYCHMLKRPLVRVGQVVERGQVIGDVGMSGDSSGPHLHFEVHFNAPPIIHGNAVDPVLFMRARGYSIL